MEIDIEKARFRADQRDRDGGRKLLNAFGIIALIVLVHTRQLELDRINAQLDAMKQSVALAQDKVDHVTYARGYFTTRPAMLECLRQLTMCFKDDERIWVNSFNVKADGKGTIIGKAQDQRTVLTVLDRIKKNPKFSDVKLGEVREADVKTHDVTFTIGFNANLSE